MEDEMKVMKERNVWDLVKLFEGAKPLGYRWVYAIKRNQKGEIARFKARLVAQGYKQVKGITFDETFSRVIHFFFSLLISCLNWSHLQQCDVKNTYFIGSSF